MDWKKEGKAMKKFMMEFKKFALRGNVMDMAVGVIVGGAFGKITTSLVGDIIMPLISMLIIFGGFDGLTQQGKWREFFNIFGVSVSVVGLVSLVLINVLAFAVAYALTQGIKGSNLFRTVFFMPNLIGGIVLGYIWSMIFDGILTRYGTSIVLETKYGFWGLIILMLWQQIGYMMIIYVAGISSITPELLEAAKIDGATPRQILFKITLPLTMPSITICTFLTLTNAFKLFDQNLALTAGAPNRETSMLALDIYNTFYGRVGSEGVGQAKGVVFFVIVAALAGLQLYLTGRKEVK